ncbi:arylamine N-acetyltransferase, pineal gland isozyme NAT-10-like [Betta splendens]|uniref:arylamine N-acetyltransferase n=1 Tax=Betta splendens TaxID=158456 RepID=A0A6P7M1Z8_BETSP|nr:arylamine N-acetyltransferase, pineal gland isozyme NAT-10-like [Betta splendens]
MKGKMNLDEYFKRIGFHGSYSKPDLATLKLIHKQHVMSVPFENLSVHCGEKITMDLEMIFNKVVRNNRGGWCMEINLLLGWVLREMGYDTVTLACRVFRTSVNDYGPKDTHLVSKVVIDGKSYIADVSYGVSSQVWEPLELVSGKDQPQAAGIFRLIDQGGLWVLEKTSRKPKLVNPEFNKLNLVNRDETKQLYRFTLTPVEDAVAYFSDTCHILQTSPDVMFTNKSICSLQMPTGFRALFGWTYSEVTYKPEEGIDVFDMRNISDDEIDHILMEKFNIKLQNKLRPVNNTICYTL